MTFANPEAFQLEAATLLATGYEHFPSQFGWEYDEDIEGYPTESGKGRQQIQFDTIRWLIDYGYLDDEFGVVGNVWQGLRLSEKGLAALNRVPDALDGKDPLGKRLVAAVAKGSWETIKVLLPSIVQEAIG